MEWWHFLAVVVGRSVAGYAVTSCQLKLGMLVGSYPQGMLGFPIHAAVVVAALLTLSPFLVAAFWPFSVEAAQRLPIAVRMVQPAALCVPYAMVAISYGQFRWGWFALYLLLPVAATLLLYRSRGADPAPNRDSRGVLMLA